MAKASVEPAECAMKSCHRRGSRSNPDAGTCGGAAGEAGGALGKSTRNNRGQRRKPGHRRRHQYRRGADRARQTRSRAHRSWQVSRRMVWTYRNGNKNRGDLNHTGIAESLGNRLLFPVFLGRADCWIEAILTGIGYAWIFVIETLVIDPVSSTLLNTGVLGRRAVHRRALRGGIVGGAGARHGGVVRGAEDGNGSLGWIARIRAIFCAGVR